MSDRYDLWIGLEIHCRLLTTRKLFCGCVVSDDASPNETICPICAGHPGSLPWLNREAIAPALRIGALLESAPQALSRFERKHYFYPDLPKGYQITQRRSPLCVGGRWRDVEIERIQLEEDAGRLIHAQDSTLIDLNRAGAPLVEIITRPRRWTPEEMSAWLRALRAGLMLERLTEGRMERGHLRFDVNISTSGVGRGPLGARVELKNLNSFKLAEAAARWEAQRQRGLRREGHAIRRETRRWTGVETQPTREKEAARDYRFLPEGNLPPLWLTQEELEQAKAARPPRIRDEARASQPKAAREPRPPRIRDEARLRRALDAAITRHPQAWARLRAGKVNLKRFFMGQVMSETQGRADPEILRDIIDARRDDEL